MTFFKSLLSARLDVRHIVPPPQSLSESSVIIGFVGAKVLCSSRTGRRPRHRHIIERGYCELQVMPVCRPNRQPQHDAASIGEHRAFDAQLAAIGGVFPGFFPRRAVLCSSRHRASASARRSHAGRRTPPGLDATICETLHALPRLESNGVNCSRSRSRAGLLSKGNLCATRNRFHPLPDARPAVVVRRMGAVAALESASARVARPTPACARTKWWFSWLGPPCNRTPTISTTNTTASRSQLARTFLLVLG